MLKEFANTLLAFGPLSALGLGSPILIAYLRRFVSFISPKGRIVLWLFLLLPPLFFLLKFSVDTVSLHGTYVPPWTGVIFYGVCSIVGMHSLEWWKRSQ